MLTENQSVYYFLLFCITARIIICLIPKYITKEMLFYYGCFLLFISSSFLYLFFTKSRLNAFESGGSTWWASYRLIHGMLYLCAAIYCFKKEKIAWIPLAIDVILGLILFINKRFIK